MDYDKLVKKQFKNHPNRLKHTYGVLKRALELGKIYQADLEVLKVASLLHDITKHESLDYHQKMINDDEVLETYPEVMLHAFSGAIYAKNLKITNERIIEAIKYHIFGIIEMNLETMILCVSDFCEENRNFKEAKKVYQASLKNIKRAYLLAMESTFDYLKEKGLKPIKIQKETYLYYKGREDK